MRSRRFDLIAIFFFAATLRLLLLYFLPVPYGNDGFGRLFFQDQLFLGHWLPLTQALVFASSAVFGGESFAIRIFFTLVSALSGCGFYLYLRLFCRPAQALAGGLIFSCNALFLFLSLMPYQGVLFLGFLFASLSFLFPASRSDFKSPLGSFLFGLACLTRYESWFLIPPLLIWRIWRERHAFQGIGLSSQRLAAALLYFGWAPLLWLGLSWWKWGSVFGFLEQTADGRPYAWNPHFQPLWMVQYAGQLFYWVGLFGSPLVFLAPLGIWCLVANRCTRHTGLVPLGLLGVTTLTFFFLIIGPAQQSVFRFCLVPLAIALVCALLGLDPLLQIMERQGLRRAFAYPLLLAALCLYGAIPLIQVNHESQYRDPFLIAEQLKKLLGAGEKALILAPRQADLTDAGPLLYQRIAVQVGLHSILAAGLQQESDPRRLIDWARRENVRYLVSVHDFEPRLPPDRFFLELAQSRSFARPVYSTGTASILRVEDWSQAKTVRAKGVGGSSLRPPGLPSARLGEAISWNRRWGETAS